jgi:hypothetical protein
MLICVDSKKGRRGAADTSEPREIAWSISRALPGLKQGTGPDGHPMSTTKSDREPPTQASREKPRGVDPKLSPGLRRALDRMVVTEGVPVNFTLQLTRREI